MPGLAPALPLNRDEVDGYELIKDFQTLVKQNLKMLILTSPGEKMMDPEFGVGLRNFLFEQNEQTTYQRIRQRVATQVGKYLPYMRIIDINFWTTAEPGMPSSGNILNMNITFYITPLGLRSEVNFELELDLENIPFL